jgi:hypothetical protein
MIGPDALEAAQKLRVSASVDGSGDVRRAALEAVAAIEGAWPEKQNHWGYIRRFPDIPISHW